MDQTLLPSPPKPRLPSPIQRVVSARLFMPVALMMVILGALSIFRPQQAPQLTYGQMNWTVPQNPSVEAKWGVRVMSLSVTADGGMLDLRLLILDPDKAINLMDPSAANLPVIISESNGGLVNSASIMPGNHDLPAGVVDFLLYRNNFGVVKHNSYVTIVFEGNILLKHVPVY